jgi:hypothetical protein
VRTSPLSIWIAFLGNRDNKKQNNHIDQECTVAGRKQQENATAGVHLEGENWVIVMERDDEESMEDQ